MEQSCILWSRNSFIQVPPWVSNVLTGIGVRLTLRKSSQTISSLTMIVEFDDERVNENPLAKDSPTLKSIRVF